MSPKTHSTAILTELIEVLNAFCAFVIAAHGDKETADVLELGRQDHHKYREVVH